MTISTSPQDPGPSADSRTLKLHDPGELLAAIPALLGFVPADSLVVVCLGGERHNSVEMVVRHDLLSLVAEPERMLALASQLRSLFEDSQVGSVSFVLIDGDWDCADPRDWHEDLVAEIGTLLIAGGAEVRGALLARDITGGGPWTSLLDPRAGRIPDPRDSAVAAAHVYQGRMIRDSREELEASIAAGPEEEVAAMAQRIAEVRAAALARREFGGRRALREELEAVLCAVALVDSGDLPEAEEIARLAVAITSAQVRDSLLGLIAGAHSAAAEKLWSLLARTAPPAERAEATALCGLSAYARGDGPFAGICVDAALDANPDHRLSILLRQALDRGMHPDDIMGLAEIGQECAASLGVRLPAP